MRFRARVTGVEGLERPLQQFSNNQKSLESWADDVIGKHPGAVVEILETMEVSRQIITKDSHVWAADKP